MRIERSKFVRTVSNRSQQPSVRDCGRSITDPKDFGLVASPQFRTQVTRAVQFGGDLCFAIMPRAQYPRRNNEIANKTHPCCSCAPNINPVGWRQAVSSHEAAMKLIVTMISR
ncbi:hypothetical protein WN55_01739 [Dufourea novaeangliae]|uniref:Uncharacterized protein n=1 Tax=Dufourea novaeangliae TaxID=178035 RepID=A0A154PGQ2_DUFNO|nr:hypothetical protein WN55_01739 [Dufourea novaeangliae]